MTHDRYHRQVLLPRIGEAGQQRLARAHAAIVGCGALGSVAADLLARAGVGTLTLIDRDVVEPTNLQRQLLFDEADARNGTPKAVAAKARLGAVNSTIAIRAHVADLNHTNAERLTGLDPQASPAVLLDGTDNFETRYLLNDLAVRHATPYVYAGAVGTTGTAYTVMPDQSPCIRCLYPDVPPPGTTPTCDTAGVLGPLIATVAAWQATQALKLLTANHAALSRNLWTWDAWSPDTPPRAIDVTKARDPSCPCCARCRFDFLDGRAASRTTTLCGRHAVQLIPGNHETTQPPAPVDLAALAHRVHAVDHLAAGRGGQRQIANPEDVELDAARVVVLPLGVAAAPARGGHPGGRAAAEGAKHASRRRDLQADRP